MALKGAWWAAALVALPSAASAGDDGATSQAAWVRYMERAHGLAVLEGGVIVLPNAPVSPGQQGGNFPIPLKAIDQGDATIQLGIHILYRPFRDWAIGANFMFDPNPTADTEYGGAAGLPRTHSRAYFFIGGEARWIPLHLKAFEAFVGAQTGIVIVADRFTTNAGVPKPAIFGDREVSLATEGFYFGAQLGADWYVTDRIIVGLVTRYNHWILPGQPTCSPIFDCTTLTGNVDSFDFGITLGYRLSL